MTQPPGTGTLSEQFMDLKKQLVEVSRNGPAFPACRVRLNANVNLPVGDTTASGSWVVSEDPFGMVVIPGGATASYILIQVDGFYTVTYHSSVIGAAAGQVAATKIMRNSTLTANSIATDLRAFPATGEGCTCHAHRPRYKLNTGDKVYWQNYVSAAAVLQANSFAVPTEITVQYIASR